MWWTPSTTSARERWFSSPASRTGPSARWASPSRATSSGSAPSKPGTSSLSPTRSIAGVRVTPRTSSSTSTPDSRSSTQRPSAKVLENAFTPPYTVCLTEPTELAFEPDEQDPAAPAVAHRPAEVLDQRQGSGDVEVDDLLELGEVAVEEVLAVRVRAGVVDQQADLEPVGGRDDLVDRVGRRQVDRQRADLDAPLAAQRGRLLELVGLAGEQHEVEAVVGELGGERRGPRPPSRRRPPPTVRTSAGRSRLAR